MLPQRMDPHHLDVDLGMPPNTLHDLFRCSLHEVDGLAVAFHDRVLRRFQGGNESEHILIKRDGFLHVGDRQHGADSLRCSLKTHFRRSFKLRQHLEITQCRASRTRSFGLSTELAPSKARARPPWKKTRWTKNITIRTAPKVHTMVAPVGRSNSTEK